MRIPVDIYHHIPTRYKSVYKLRVTKAQYAVLNEGKDLSIKGRFRLLKNREIIVFAPVFILGADGTKFLGVKHESGKLSYIPRHYLTL